MKSRDFRVLVKILDGVQHKTKCSLEEVVTLKFSEERRPNLTVFLYDYALLGGEEVGVAKRLLLRLCKLETTGDKVPQHIVKMIFDHVVREVNSRADRTAEELTLLTRRLEIAEKYSVGALIKEQFISHLKQGQDTLREYTKPAWKGFRRRVESSV